MVGGDLTSRKGINVPDMALAMRACASARYGPTATDMYRARTQKSYLSAAQCASFH